VTRNGGIFLQTVRLHSLSTLTYNLPMTENFKESYGQVAPLSSPNFKRQELK